VGHGAVLHGCTIERNGMVGMNAVVMDQAVVGESSIVAAMAFVKSGMVIPPRSLVVGAPARVLRTLSDSDIEHKSYGTRQYQLLTQRCLQTMKRVEPLREPEENRPRLRADQINPAR
jgi:carbonic anhydrase/acetyltransferase-like protein (isoleucine patch superfamily)